MDLDLPVGRRVVFGVLLAPLALSACGEEAPMEGPRMSEVDARDAAKERAALARAWSADTTVGQVVAEAPATVRVFELVKIDYCCGGNRALRVAADEQGLDVTALLGALAAVGEPGDEAARIRWDKRPLPEVVDHIVSTHHVFLRRELPRLAGIVATVARVHGESHPELAEVLETFNTLHEDLIPHLEHEETVVFPAVRKLAQGERTAVLETSLEQMRTEHDGAGAAIHELRRLLKDYEPPADACTLYKEMLKGLHALERDTLTHVHLENNVLLPRCLAAR